MLAGNTTYRPQKTFAASDLTRQSRAADRVSKSFTRYFVCSSLFILLIASHAAHSQIRHVVTLQDLQSLEEATYVQVSPQDDMVAYVWKKSLWLVATRPGSVPRQFGKADFPLWSPDGKTIAYYSHESGTNQLWMLNVATGMATQVTDLKDGIDPEPRVAAYWSSDPLRYSWSPDSTKLVFASRVGVAGESNETIGSQGGIANGGQGPLVLNRYTPAEWTLKGVLASTDNRPNWSGKNINTGKASQKFVSQLFIADSLTRRVKQLTYDEFQYYHPAWSPDGGRILFASTAGRRPKPQALTTTNIYSLDLTTGERKALTSGLGQRRAPAWSPDGKWVAFLGRRGFGQTSVYVLNLDGQQHTSHRLPAHRNVMDFHWWPNSKSILLVMVDGVSWPICKFNVRSRSGSTISVPGEAAHRWPLSVSMSGSIVWQQSDGSQTGSIMISPAGEKTPYPLINLNPQIRDWALGKQEVVRWKTRRGEHHEGVLILPAGYRRGVRYPLIVDGYPHIDNMFLGLALIGNQAWASEGYAVFFPDARAPHVYENHFKTESFDQEARGPHGWDVTTDDVMSGVDELIRRGIADPMRMALYGFSNGGGVVDYLVTRTHRFRCAVSLAAALPDWLLPFFLKSDSQIPLWAGGITPWSDPQGYVELSAIFRLNRVSTPMLLADGDNDGDFLLGSIEVYNGLRWLGKDVTLLRYPGQGHGLTGAALEDFWRRENMFLDAHLGLSNSNEF